MKILITGAAGFIGYHLSARLCEQGHDIIGMDNINDYYSPSLKTTRLTILKAHPRFTFCEMDIRNEDRLNSFFNNYFPDIIIHFAAEVGVRNSLQNPEKYISTNLVGFSNMLTMARKKSISHFIFASSSSVYGSNEKFPSSEQDRVDHPISLYAATKKANELLAHSYAHLYHLKCTGLRFFTVYGPWGRPDMAYYQFAQKILDEKPIDVFHNGEMQRDFTYIDDIVEGINRIIHQPPSVLYSIYNIGRGEPIALRDLISLLEKYLGKKAIKNYLPLPAGDVLKTEADTRALQRDFHYAPKIDLETGIAKFVEWFNQYSASTLCKASITDSATIATSSGLI